MATRKHKVLVADPVDSSGLKVLESVAEVDVKPNLSEDALCGIIGDYDAMLVRSATTVTKKVLENGKRLKIVARAGVGVDNVDVPAASERGIFVVNSPLGNTVAAAEHTLAMMFAVFRHIPAADASVRSGKWTRSAFMGTELRGKTLGIVGLGQVGSHVGSVARELGMKLIGYDPYVNEAKAKALNCEMMALPNVLAEADVITLHVPLIDETRHLINEESISTMKPSVRIVNCSRGGVVDETALAKALVDKRIAGAALDVFEEEKAFPEGHPLLSAPNLVLTPHLGASTVEAQLNVALDVAEQVKVTLNGGMPSTAVNMALKASEVEGLLPLIDLCERLGQFSVQLLDAALEGIELVLEGGFASERGEALLLACAAGALKVHSASPVNFINARKMADSKKVSLRVTKEPSHVKSAVRVSCLGKDKRCLVKGTVTEDKRPLMSELMSVPVYLLLDSNDGTYVCTRHSDKPNTISRITGVFGRHGVNIGDLHLGRVAETKEAVIVLSIDNAMTPAAQEGLRNEPNVLDTHVVHL